MMRKSSAPSKAPVRQMNRRPKNQPGQSMVELALALPLLVVLLVGMIEVAFAARTYLAILEATREGARLGARGSANFDNNEISTLVQQNLSREGYDTGSNLEDIIIVRADVGPGATVNSYVASSMLGSGETPHLTLSTMLSRLAASDPQTRIVAVEICYDHPLLIGFPVMSDIFPNPYRLHVYSIMRMLQ